MCGRSCHLLSRAVMYPRPALERCFLCHWPSNPRVQPALPQTSHSVGVKSSFPRSCFSPFPTCLFRRTPPPDICGTAPLHPPCRRQREARMQPPCGHSAHCPVIFPPWLSCPSSVRSLPSRPGELSEAVSDHKPPASSSVASLCLE